MILAAVETTENWPEAAIAIAGIALVGSVVIVAVWQLLATWRTRMVGSRETEYRCSSPSTLTCYPLDPLARPRIRHSAGS